MAELKHYDIVGAGQNGFAFGTQQRLQREGEQRQNALASLSAQAYGAQPDQRQGIVQQAIGTDPQAGFALNQQLGYDDDRRTKNLVNMSKMLTSAPEAHRAGLYRRMIPTLQQFGLSDLPPEYDETVGQTAKSIVQAYSGAAGGTVHSQKIGEDGFIYNTMRDGSLVNTGVRADRQAWFRDHPGMPPEIVGKDGTVRPVGSSSSEEEFGPPARFGADVGGTEARADIAGLPPEANQRAAQMVALMTQAGYPEAEIDAYMAAQARQGSELASAAAPTYGTQQGGNQLQTTQQVGRARPSEAQIAADRAAAERGVENSMPALPSGYRYNASGNMEAIPGGPADPAVMAARPLPPAQRQKLEQTQRKERQMLSTMEASMDQSIRLVDELLEQRGSLSGVTGLGAIGARIPGTPWADIAAKLDTLKARSAFGSLQEMRANSPTGGALGAVSERELYLLQNAETQLQNSQSPEALAKGLQDYKNTLLSAKNRLRAGVDEFYEESGVNRPDVMPAQTASDIDALLDTYR